MLTKAADAVEGHADLSRIDFESLLSKEFQTVASTLAKGALAAYLLGRFRITERATNFAEGDDDKKQKKKPVRRRPWREEVYQPFGKDQTAAEIITPDDSAMMGLRFDVPPEEAIRFFREKKILPPEDFYRLEAASRAGAFAITGVYKTDVLKAFRSEIVATLENGLPSKQLANRFRSILDGQTGVKKELTDLQLETVARTMMGISYAVGQRNGMEDVADILPIWKYSAVGDDRTRPSHAALDGLEYPANHPFWDLHYPPWEFNCRCDVIPQPHTSKGYNPERPNSRTSIEYGSDGLPKKAGVDGILTRIEPGRLSGAVPRRTSLGDALMTSADRAKEARLR